MKDIIDYNHDILKELAENEQEISKNNENKKYPALFEEYSESIQKEALKIVKDGKLLDNLVYSTNITHQGDETQIKNDFRTYASLFLKKPVHKFNNGESGAGKSHLENETLAHIPDQYVHRFGIVSAKFIFYESENFHPLYNIFAFNDFKENEDNIETGKTLADNETMPKELKTVSKDRKSEKFTIPGYCLSRYNSAKQISDVEFLNRFFLDDISNNEEHKKEVKNKTKDNELYNTSTSIILKQGREILKCAWQYLIEKEIEVFNPYSLFLNVESINNRNIKGYLTYIKCNSFFEYHNRGKVKGVVIGNFEDFSSIANKIEKETKKQNYKLTGLQEELINLLPTYEEKKIKEIQEKGNNDLEEAKKGTYTYDILAKLLKKNKSSIVNAVNGIKGGSAPSLVDLGLISRKEFNPGSHRKDVFLYKTENSGNDLNINVDTNHVVYFENKLAFDTLNKKIVLLYSFLSSLNILINKQTKKNITLFCENNSKPLNSYEKICNFLESFILDHKNELIEITETNKVDFESIVFHHREVERYKKNDEFFVSITDESKNKPPLKTDDTALNEKQDKQSQFKKEINLINQTKNDNKDQIKEIEKEVFENVKNKSITNKTRLIESIAPINDNIKEHYNFIDSTLKDLVNKRYIKINKQQITLTAEFTTYYDSHLKNIKGGLL